jgi:hypothetical protein
MRNRNTGLDPLWILLLVFTVVHAVPFFTYPPAPPPNPSVNCTVDSGSHIPSPQYTDLQTAIDDCRGPSGNLTNVTLLLYGDYSIGNQSLFFPADAANITLVGMTNSTTGTTLSGVGMMTDPYERSPWITFRNLNFDLGGSNDTGLFYPRLHNQNLTITNCTFIGYNGSYMLEQEPCQDQVVLTIRDSVFRNIDGGAWRILGVDAFDIQNNRFPNCGNSIVNRSFGYLQLSAVSGRTNYFNRNWHWRIFECRKLRCLYSMYNQSSNYEFRCNHGTTECLDRKATAKFHCQIGNFVLTDAVTNHTTIITNDFDPQCRQWTPCLCNTVVWHNRTSGRSVNYPDGNLVLSNGQILPCVPAPGEPLLPQSPFFEPLGVRSVKIGIKPSLAQSFTFVQSHNISKPNSYFKNGVISPGSCFCPKGDLPDSRDPLVVPCEYIIEPPNASIAALNSTFSAYSGMPPPNYNILINQDPPPANISYFNAASLIPSFCQEDSAFCCAAPNQYDYVYKHECSLYPDRCAPALWPNGTAVNPFQPEFYDCEYLTNCTTVPGGVSNCTKFRCNRKRCEDGVVYALSDPCYQALNLNSNVTYIEMDLTGAQLDSLVVNAGGIVTDYYSQNGTSDAPGAEVLWINQTAGIVMGYSGNISLYTLIYSMLWTANITNATYGTGNSTITVPVLTIVAGQVVFPLSGLTYPISFNGGIINTATFRSPLPACNDLSIPTTDQLCLFAREDCGRFYTGNYLTPGIFPFGTPVDPMDPNPPFVVSQTCTFKLDDCAKFQGNPMCICQDCHFNPCRTGQFYPTSDTCFQQLNLGSNATEIYLPAQGGTLSLFSVDVGLVVQSLLWSGGTFPSNGASIGGITQLAGSLQFMTVTSGTMPVLAYLGGKLWDATIYNVQLPDLSFVNVTVVSGVVTSPTSGINGTSLSTGFVASATFQLPFAQCNDLSVNGSSSALCNFFQNSCEQFIDIDNGSGYVFNPSNYQLPTACPLVSPSKNRPINQTLFTNVTAGVCEFSPQQCGVYLDTGYPASYADSQDDRCDCTSVTSLCVVLNILLFNQTCNDTCPTNTTCDCFYNVSSCLPATAPSGFIPMNQIVASMVLNNVSQIPPGKIPRIVLFRQLNGTAMNCSTNLWYQCDCPPYYQPNDPVSICDPDTELLNGTCLSFKIIGAQECLNTVNCTLPDPPNQYNVIVNNAPLVCDSHTNTMSCDCGAYLISLQYPTEGAVTWEFAHISNRTKVQIIDTSACYHNTAVQIQDVSITALRAMSTVKENWFDEYTLSRIIFDNLGEFNIGQQADIAENAPFTPYRRECEDGCRSDFRAPTREQDYECVVDSHADENDPRFGVTLFSSLNMVNDLISFDGVCTKNRTVLIKYSAKFYQEPEDWSNRDNPNPDALRIYFYGAQRNFIFASLDGAVIVGSQYQFDKDAFNMTFIGIHFVHPGDGTQFMEFIITHSTNGDQRSQYINFYNCIFDGRGTTAGWTDTYNVRYMDLRYNTFINFNVVALRVLFIDELVMIGNTFIDCAGRVIQARYYQAVNIIGNTFIDCRPGPDLRGAAIIWLRDCCSQSCMFGNSTDNLRMADFRNVTYPQISSGLFNNMTNVWPVAGSWYSYFPADRFSNGVGKPGGMYNFFSDYRRIVPVDSVDGEGHKACQVRRNFHITDPTQTDQEDGFLVVYGGFMQPFHWTDNGVLKAQFGVQVIEIPGVSGDEVDQAAMCMLNPEIRNSDFRLTPDIDPSVEPGSDFTGFSFQNVLTPNGFVSNQLVDWSCDFPCNDFIQNAFFTQNLTCIQNGDFGLEYMPDYSIGLPRYGHHTFGNLSDAGNFCDDGQQELDPFDDTIFLNVPRVYVTTYNGHRYIYDTLFIAKSIWLIGNNSVGNCPYPRYRPASRGSGNTISAPIFRMSSLQFEFSEIIPGQNLWQSGDVTPQIVEIEDCIFDGNNVIPTSNVFALQFYMGVIIPNAMSGSVQSNPAAATANELTSQLPPKTRAFFRFDNNVVQNFTQFYPRVTTPNRYRQDTVQLGDYPWTTGLDVTFINILNTMTMCLIRNNTFWNIDRTACSIRFPINITFTGNYGGNISGRSVGNAAAVYIEGNPLYSTAPDVTNEDPQYPAFIELANNYFYQLKEILVNYTQAKSNIQLLVGIWFRKLPLNATFCINNNSFFTYPIAARFGDFAENIWTPCLTPPNNIFFPDGLRFLRAIAHQMQCNYRGDPVNETGLPGLNGTSHDIEWAFIDAYLEAVGSVFYCDRCCPPEPPDVCYVEPPGVDFLFTPAHPWWDTYVFTSIVECANHCNATSRICQLVGNVDDPFGAFQPYGLPIPMKVWNEVIDFAVGPNINSNQTGLVIRGMQGATVCATGGPHRIDNPLHLSVSVEGIIFDHCDPLIGKATWDWSDLSYDSTNIQLLGNEFQGNGTRERPINGVFDTQFNFTGNFVHNYTGDYNARFMARKCNETVLITENTFQGLPGVNLEVLGYDNPIVGNGKVKDSILGQDRYSNVFIEAGGSVTLNPLNRYVLFVSTCLNTNPGTVTVWGNQIFGPQNNSINCFSPLWSGIFIAPSPWKILSPWTFPLTAVDTKNMVVRDNFVDDFMCIGMRLDNTTFRCDTPDQKGYLRQLIYYDGRNNNVQGSVFDLYIGPYNAVQEGQVLFTPDDPGFTCRHCEDGCQRSSLDTAALVIGSIILALVVLFCCCWFACPAFCWLCPHNPTTWHYDSTLGRNVPDDRSGRWLPVIRMGPVWRKGRPLGGQEGDGDAARAVADQRGVPTPAQVKGLQYRGKGPQFPRGSADSLERQPLA